jgi:hypothetical protein
MGRSLRAAALAGGVALIVLVARSIAYAVTPGPVARELEHRAGGPALPIVALVAIVLCGLAAITICWLATVAVRERALLEEGAPPAFPAGRVLLVALLFAVASTIAGGLVEAWVHWRAGLGWHGLRCIAGPVHRDLPAIECALSLVASALLAAAEHVRRWMQRTFSLLRALPPGAETDRGAPPRPRADGLQAAVHVLSGGARAPPAFS